VGAAIEIVQEPVEVFVFPVYYFPTACSLEYSS
jgi:hypothetical protein